MIADPGSVRPRRASGIMIEARTSARSATTVNANHRGRPLASTPSPR